MPHSSPEHLALAALGEPLPAADAAHLAGCRQCRAEVASLHRPVAELRSTAGPVDDAPPVQPPDRVWAAIAAATGVAATPRTVPGDPAPDPSLPSPRESSPRPGAGTTPPSPLPVALPGRSRAAGTADPQAAPTVDLEARRARRRRWVAAGAVAAGLLVGGGIGAGIRAALTSPAVDRLASADLEPLDDPGASGSAALVEESGRVSLRVDLQADPPAGEYFEVWLLAADGPGLVSLGILDDGTADLPVPAAVDLASYPTVDISLEPSDGDPQHSTISVARGSLS